MNRLSQIITILGGILVIPASIVYLTDLLDRWVIDPLLWLTLLAFLSVGLCLWFLADAENRSKRGRLVGVATVLVSAVVLYTASLSQWLVYRQVPTLAFAMAIQGEQPENARLLYEGLTGDLRKRNAFLMICKGGTYEGTGDLQRALECYREARKLSPDSPIPEYNVAVMLRRLGRYEESIAEWHAYRRKSDWDLVARYELGITHQMNGQVDSAIVYYQQAAKAKSARQESALFNEATCHAVKYRATKSAQEARLAIECLETCLEVAADKRQRKLRIEEGLKAAPGLGVKPGYEDLSAFMDSPEFQEWLRRMRPEEGY